MASKIVICIPLKLNNRAEIATSLLDKYGTEYLFMGRVFRETTSNFSCEIHITSAVDHNLNLREAIAFAGQDKILANTLDEISHCPQVLYLTSSDLGYQTCLAMARFTRVFLDIGGVAVNIESGEIAHEANNWLNKYNSQDIFDIYSLYVGLVEGENSYYSCGMQNFGKADVSVEITEDIGLAIYVMNLFNYYRLTESPILQDGHTFQPDIESPKYQIKLIGDRECKSDSWHHNSFGRWHLTPY